MEFVVMEQIDIFVGEDTSDRRTLSIEFVEENINNLFISSESFEEIRDSLEIKIYSGSLREC